MFIWILYHIKHLLSMRIQNDTGFLRPHRWLPENLRPFSHEQRPLLYSAGSSLCSMMPVFQTYLCIGFGWTNWNIKNKTPALTRGSSGTPFQNRSVPQVFSKSIRAFESADGLIPWWWWELYVTAFFLGAAPCLQTSPTTDISSYRRRAHWHLWTR